MNSHSAQTTNGPALRILFLTKYSSAGASSRYRVYQYLPYLEQAGYACQVSPLFDDDYLHNRYVLGRGKPADFMAAFWRRLRALLSCRRFDLLVIEYELLPFFPPFIERLLQRLGIPYIVDYDDALFHQYDSHRRIVVRRMLGGKIAAVMRGARAVIAGNRYLADYAREAGARRVEMIPTVVDLDRYPVEATDSPTFTIGWIGSPATAGYLDDIAPALRDVCIDGDVRVRLVGAGDVDLPGVPVEVLPWNEESEVACLQSFHVGIMPLPDTPWARGKCGLKLIQYMACGIPVVASPVGVNEELLCGGQTGISARDTADWIEALRALQRNPSRRKDLGQAGRRLVEQSYSLQARWPEYLSLIRSLL